MRKGISKPYWKRNDYTSSKPIIINQPGGSAIVEKLSPTEILRNRQLIKKSGGDIELIRQLKEKLKNVIDEPLPEDPVYSMTKMVIPKLQDTKSQEIALQVDQLLTMDKQLLSRTKKLSTTYLLFGPNDQPEKEKFKEQYFDILHKQCANIFPEELVMQYQINKGATCALTK